MTRRAPEADDNEFVSRQHDHASAERARQAREQFESLYEARVKQDRLQQGVCILCGEELHWVARWWRRVRHRRCTTFSES